MEISGITAPESDRQSFNMQDIVTTGSYKDGARAWAVATAALFTVCLTLGIYRSAGILFVEFMEVFEASATQSSILFVCYGISFTLSGLLMNTALGGVFHERALVTIGSTIGAFGFIITFFATRIEHVTFGLGLCLGANSQIGLSSSLTIIGKYFDKRLTLGASFAIIGSSVGVIVLPILTRFLLDEFSYRGACLILGGLVLNCYVCAGVMCPPEYLEPKVSKDGIDTGLHYISSCKRTVRTTTPGPGTTPFGLSIIGKEETPMLGFQEVQKAPSNSIEPFLKPEAMSHNQQKKICRRFIRAIQRFVLTKTHQRTEKQTITQIFALSFFTNPSTVLFLVVFVLAELTADCIIQFYPAVLHDIGFNNYDSSYLLSLIGVSGIFGRLFIGFLGDYARRRYIIVVIANCSLGVAVVLNHLAVTFWSQMVYALTVGVTFGVPFTYRVSLMRDFFPKANVVKMVGLNQVLAGLGVICGNLFMGWLRDFTDGYSTPMYIVAFLFFLMGFLLLCIVFLNKCQDRKQDSFEPQGSSWSLDGRR